MFTVFEKLAKLLNPIRHVFILAAMLSASTMVYLFIFANINTQNRWLVIALLCFIWSMLLQLLPPCFQPLETNNRKGLLASLRQKFVRVFQMLFSIIFIGVSVVTLHLSIKLLTL